MGIFDHGIEPQRRTAHDGALRCVLCSNASPEADHDWCPAAGCLVCDECCIALLQGDPHRIVSIISAAGHVVTPDALFHACADCGRGLRTAAEHALDEEDGPIC